MKRIALTLTIVLLQVRLHAAVISVAATPTGGAWNDPMTWVGGVVPSDTDSEQFVVEIPSGSEVILDAVQNVTGLSVGGSLIGAGSLTVQGDGIFSDGSYCRLKGGLEFINDLLVQGKVQVSCPVRIENTATLSNAEVLFLSFNTSFYVDAYLHVLPEAVLTLHASVGILDPRQSSFNPYSNGFRNEGVVIAASGSNRMIFDYNAGLVDIQAARLVVSSREALGGSFSWDGSSSLVLELVRMIQPSLLGQGSLEVGQSYCVIDGGTIRAAEIVADDAALYLENVYDCIIQSVNIGSSGTFRCTNSIIWAQQKVTLTEGSAFRFENSRFVCPLIEGDGGTVTMGGQLDGALDLQAGSFSVADSLVVNGDVSLGASAEVFLFLSETDKPEMMRVNGTFLIDCPVSIQATYGFLTDLDSIGLLTADSLNLAYPVNSEIRLISDRLKGRVVHDLEGNRMDFTISEKVLHPWVWYILEAGGDPVAEAWSAESDFDGDGVLNYEEMAFGSNPTNGQSIPVLWVETRTGTPTVRNRQTYLHLTQLRDLYLNQVLPVGALISADMLTWGILGTTTLGVDPNEGDPLTHTLRQEFGSPWETFFLRPYVDPKFIAEYNAFLER
ncbi:MAG: hypothetical protein AB3N33_12945 [Puniceicoccaceae bacterium]